MNTLDKVSHAAERKAMEVAIDHIVKGLDKDRTGEYLKLIDLAEKFYGKGFSKAMTQRELRYRIQTTNG